MYQFSQTKLKEIYNIGNGERTSSFLYFKNIVLM